VNATGNLGSAWKIAVEFDGGYTNTNITNSSLITIGKVLIINVSTSLLDWGNLDPSLTCQPTEGLSIRVSVDPNSNDAEGVYLNGTDLLNQQFASTIESTNITWCKSPCTCEAAKLNDQLLREYYQQVHGLLPAGEYIDILFWLDTPATYYGTYKGYMEIMANASW
jgi:hypothetical protein